MRTDEELLQANSHIPSSEVEKDIADTEAEILTMENEAAYLEQTPLSLPNARLDHMRAASRRTGIRERQEFIAKLRHLLDLRRATA